MPSLMDMEKKSVIVGGGITGSIVGLFLLVTAVAIPSVGATHNCVNIECLKRQLERICKEGTAPSYLDCESILRCIDAEEQEIMQECARGYSLVEEEIGYTKYNLCSTIVLDIFYINTSSIHSNILIRILFEQ